MRIIFLNQDPTTARIPRTVICHYAQRIERFLGRRARNAELSVIFVTSKRSRELNTRYRGKKKPTNVLSFETDDCATTFGDILICPAVARREAEEQEILLTDWLVHLFVHGALHLFGYDHVRALDERRMSRLEQTILKK